MPAESARDVEVSAYFHGIDNARYDDLGENDKGEDLVSLNPSLEWTYGTWYKGRYMTITRERTTDRIIFSLRPRDTLKIRYLSSSCCGWFFRLLTERRPVSFPETRSFCGS